MARSQPISDRILSGACSKEAYNGLVFGEITSVESLLDASLLQARVGEISNTPCQTR